MAYLKKEYRKLLNECDNKFIIPKSFKKFIDENKSKHQLIIKSKKDNCYCTNCKSSFISTKKINDYEKCPVCKMKLLIKSDRLKNFVFKDNLQLLDKFEDIFVLRTFELYSVYEENSVKHYLTEFMRSITKNNQVIDFVTNQVHNNMGYMYISHYQKFVDWRLRDYRWSYRDIHGLVSPYNIKNILKKTTLKYSQLNNFLSHVGYIDLFYYLNNIAYLPSFEMLVKLKLYNLAKEANKFYKGKTFYEILGVPKTMYKFLKKYNLNYNELVVLRLIQKENIEVIKGLSNLNNIDLLSKYVDLEQAYYKVLKNNIYKEYEYLDYLEICFKLKYNMKDKKILYPSDLQHEHNKVVKLLTIVNNEKNDKLIKNRLSDLNKYIFQAKNYIIFPADSVSSLIEESEQQNNCVKTYCEKYALGKCDIFYMRNIESINSSLVTIEVRNKKVVQTRIKDNKLPTDDQSKVIKYWENKVLS